MAKPGKRAKENPESKAGNGEEAATPLPALSQNVPPSTLSEVKTPEGSVAPNSIVANSAATTPPAGAATTPPAEAESSSRRPTDRLIVGWLRGHGPAQHAFRPKAEPSYFLKLQTRDGEQLVWGKGLERALAISRTRPQIGDEIGVREIEIRPIAIASAEPKVEGGAVTAPTPRTHWVIERTAFFAERAAAAQALRDPQAQPREVIRAHPDLIGAYFTLDAARKVAETKIANPESRERFVALVRETLAHAVERGEPIIEPRRREDLSAQRWQPYPRTSQYLKTERSR
jgi:hypothetical protein